MKDHLIPENEFPMVLTPGVTLLGNYFFNLFLVRGKKKSALFETGISGIVDRVIDQLESLGVEPDYLIPSHPHSDHITGLPGLAERFPKAEILSAAGAAEFVTHPKAGPLLINEDRFLSLSLEKMGIMPGRPSLERIPDLSGSRVIPGRTEIDLGGTLLELIPVSGHSPGNLMGRVRQEKILLCSDSLGFHFPGRGFWPLFFTGAETYLQTLDLIRDLSPDIICPAHQGPLKGEAAQKGIQEAMETTHAVIRRVKASRLPDKDLVMDLFRESYKDEFTLYTQENIKNCSYLLIKRARDFRKTE
ncbi:MBL fold metallo-hydrolase [Desulfospira joergensenii]|uniref:MBL fold metallo-hydrolase n=1 Tax=Desulfospira joergensenii TaxID=53329 RepID=UPI0003B3EB28|nr:MBL fold metallo-hydrolase [Desulfospira joergensenii]